jgi:hypothetical protein
VPPPPTAGMVLDRPFVVFIHGTSRTDKRWPDEHWRRLIEARDGGSRGGPAMTRRRRTRAQRAHAGVPTRAPPPARAARTRGSSRVPGRRGRHGARPPRGRARRRPFRCSWPPTPSAAASGPPAHARDHGGSVPPRGTRWSAAGGPMRRAPRC